MGLLTDPKKSKRMHLLSTESFEETFSAKKRRKRPRIGADSLESLVQSAESRAVGYDESDRVDEDRARVAEAAAGGPANKDEARASIFDKGQSRRIWGELYKVLDCSDVVIQVLDARDPMGTRSQRVETHLRKNARHKHLIFVLNKCDLVPTWVTRRWVARLSQEYPTLAFHASVNKSFGKGALIQLLRQYAKLHGDKPQISVGLIGACIGGDAGEVY